MANDIILGEIQPPKPGEYFVNEVIHPDNVRLAVQLASFKPLTRQQMRRLEREGRRLHKSLAKAEFFARLSRFEELRDEYTEQLEGYRDVYAQAMYARHHAPQKLGEIVPALRSMQTNLRPLKERLIGMQSDLAELMPDYRRYNQIRLSLENNERRTAEYNAQEKINRGMERESRQLAKMLREVWGAHRDTHYKVTLRHNRKRRIIPQVESIDIEATSIWIKIKASTKGWFGYKYALPTDVHISDLINEDILQTYSRAIRREVQVFDNPNGTWIVVNRLDSPGGIIERVAYSTVMKGFYPTEEREHYPYPAGVAEGNRIVWLDFSRWNHILVGGFTGGGKSNFMNVVISTLIREHAPADARFVFIDLKRNEFNLYEGIPHLLVDPVYNIEDANHVLHQMIELMEERYELLQAYRVKKIEDYNRRVPQANRLPRVFIMLDEAGELTGYGALTKEVHHALARLTALGRAAGIHCVICTQRPEVAVIPGRVKANCAVRISFRSADTESSKVIIGVGAAKELPAIVGRAVLLNSPDPVIIQTPYISDEDVLEAVEIAKTYGQPDDIALPQAEDHKVIRFDEYSIIEYVHSDMEGRWAMYRVWDALKDNPQFTLSQKKLRHLMTKAEKMLQREPVIINGVRYSLDQKSARQRELIGEHLSDEELQQINPVESETE